MCGSLMGSQSQHYAWSSRLACFPPWCSAPQFNGCWIGNSSSKGRIGVSNLVLLLGSRLFILNFRCNQFDKGLAPNAPTEISVGGIWGIGPGVAFWQPMVHPQCTNPKIWRTSLPFNCLCYPCAAPATIIAAIACL